MARVAITDGGIACWECALKYVYALPCLDSLPITLLHIASVNSNIDCVLNVLGYVMVKLLLGNGVVILNGVTRNDIYN